MEIGLRNEVADFRIGIWMLDKTSQELPFYF
jgi:hypothetical protein